MAYFSVEETIHIRKSMRKKQGDQILVLDGEGMIYQSTVQDHGNGHVSAKIREAQRCPKPSYRLEVALAITKQAQRFEWFVEKAVEMGIHKIIPLVTKRTEKAKVSMDRLRRIAIGASKQAGNPYLPVLQEPLPFSGLLDTVKGKEVYIAHCENPGLPFIGDQVQKGRDVIVLIGPEGDFTPIEIDMAVELGCQEISLGQHRLRTETAGVYVTSLFAIINQNK